MNSKYIILKKLGWGHFSTVWLAFNTEDKRLYALKVMRANPRYERVGFDEQELIRVIMEKQGDERWVEGVDNQCVQMFDWFFHYGANGKHFVMVFEVLGKNLLNLINRYGNRGIPIPLVREITKQILTGLSYMHSVCNMIHTDLKPENVTFAISKQEEFNLLYRYVFSTPLISLYDTTTNITSSSTSDAIPKTKSQKKRDRKKRK